MALSGVGSELGTHPLPDEADASRNAKLSAIGVRCDAMCPVKVSPQGRKTPPADQAFDLVLCEVGSQIGARFNRACQS